MEWQVEGWAGPMIGTTMIGIDLAAVIFDIFDRGLRVKGSGFRI